MTATCKTNAHKFVTTFDHTATTGTKRQTCAECGMLRWDKDGSIETWMPGQYAKLNAQPVPVTLAPESDTELRQLFDDVQALPLFSGTAPRVADPGRYDPPAQPDEYQPSLF